MSKHISNYFIFFTFVWISASAFAGAGSGTEFHLSGKPLLYEPELDKRVVHLARIDSEYLEIGPYAGLLSVEDFGANVVTGVRLVLHPMQWMFLEGAHGRSAVTDETFRRKNMPVIKSGDGFAELTYSYVSVGINIMPGEVYLGRSLAFTSGVYVLGGIGNTEFDDHNWPTVVYGMGLRVLPIDWIALHMDVRGFEFESELLGRRKMTHNVELNVGASVYF
ncbi:MAG: outer membrane beta-barrel domain-containing protein [Pseudomonadota bacterium]